MRITTRSGLFVATKYVETFLASNGVPAKVCVGWKQRSQHINQGPGGANRVVFIPSGPGGAGGTMLPARFPGPRNVRATALGDPVANIRSLASWERRVQVSIWGFDGSQKNDEEAQIEATEALFEWVVRAVHSAPGAFAEAKFGDVEWTIPAQLSLGVEALVGLTFKQPIFDVPRELVFPTSTGVTRAPYIAPAAGDPPDGDT